MVQGDYSAHVDGCFQWRFSILCKPMLLVIIRGEISRSGSAQDISSYLQLTVGQG